MPLLENLRKCVSRRHGLSRRCTKVIFNVKISDSFKSQNVPSQIRDLLVYIAREGVAVTDLFRRPGNPQDIKKIISDLESGKPITWTDYNFYTLANIAKRYLLHIDGGILGPTSEEKLLSTLNIPDDQTRIEAMHSVITSQPKPVQQLLALLFGIWFRMIYHAEVNAMSVEAVAKSVAGSVFPSCTTTPSKVEQASKVMEYLITGFASTDLFSRELIEYFTLETKTSISRVEKFKYEFRFPKDVPREKSVRLFVQMLLEEGRKHGFHLIHDAVSKEVFERASWENVFIPSIGETIPRFLADESSLSPTVSSSPKENYINPHLSTHKTREHTTVGGETLICTETSSTLTPTLSRRVNYSLPTDPTDCGLYSVPIQQTSEKRTRVTATSITEALSAATGPRSDPLDLSKHPGFYGDEHQILKSTPIFASTSLPKVYTHSGDIPLKATSRSSGSQSTNFNSVKQRQLERLQKRSDWFLSPPAGLRSTGLMHLDPHANGICSSELIPPATAMMVTESSDDPYRRHHHGPHAELSEVGSTSTTDLVDLGGDEVTEGLLPTLMITDDRLDDDELRRLAQVAPEKVWFNGGGNLTGFAHEQRNNNLSHRDNTFQLLSDAATNSPRLSTDINSNNNCHSSKLDYLGYKPYSDEKENYPEIETRYYVVQRYYGPDPRPPSGLTAASRSQRLLKYSTGELQSC